MNSESLKRRKFLVMGCTMAAASLTGCASLTGVDGYEAMPGGVMVWALPAAVAGQPDPALKKRIENYWAAHYWRKIEPRYFMEVRAFRERYDNEFYAGYYSKAWLLEEVVVQDMAFQEGEKVSFNLKLATRKKDTGEVRTSQFWDSWVREDGEWYHVHNDPLLKY